MISIGVDIDDTLCDFIGPLNEYYNTKYGTSHVLSDYVTYGFSNIWSRPVDECHSIISEFIFLDTNRDYIPHQNSYSVLEELKKTGYISFYAISARDDRLKDATVSWINRHYPDIFTNVILCNYYGPGERKCKTEVCKELGIKIFIDDRPDNIKCDSIRLLTYAQPWNSSTSDRVSNWKEVGDALSETSLVKIINRNITDNILVGVSGKIGSGKDLCGTVITTNFTLFRQTAFARKLKLMVCALVGCTYEDCDTREGKAKIIPWLGKTIGKLLQEIGVSLRESVDEDIWLKACLDTDDDDDDYHNGLVVTDTRFLNEADGIKERGGIVIRVNGDPVGIRERNEDGRDLSHISETALDDYPFEYVIENNGSKDELERKVMGIMIPYLFDLI